MSEFDCDRALRRCQRGDAAALEELIAHLQQRVMQLAWRMTGNASLAEEATAQVFVKLWSKSGQWRGDSAATTWIYQLATRTILDTLRAQNRWWRRRRSIDDSWGSGCDASEELQRTDEAAALTDCLQRAMRELSAEDRALVQLYYFEELPLAELETVLGAGTDVLKMRLYRARKRLRSVLEANGFCNDAE